MASLFKINIYRFFILIILALTFGLGLSSCGSHKAHTGNKHHSQIPHVSVKGLSGTRKAIVEESLKWMDTPYAYGKSERGKGTDCSGMVLAVYRDVAGVMMPRNSAQQADYSKKLSKGNVKPGDLVFFATGKDPNRISHVGIMLDDDRFIHASTSKGVVISSVSTPYYIKTFKKYGRVLK